MSLEGINQTREPIVIISSGRSVGIGEWSDLERLDSAAEAAVKKYMQAVLYIILFDDDLAFNDATSK